MDWVENHLELLCAVMTVVYFGLLVFVLVSHQSLIVMLPATGGVVPMWFMRLARATP